MPMPDSQSQQSRRAKTEPQEGRQGNAHVLSRIGSDARRPAACSFPVQGGCAGGCVNELSSSPTAPSACGGKKFVHAVRSPATPAPTAPFRANGLLPSALRTHRRRVNPGLLARCRHGSAIGPLPLGHVACRCHALLRPDLCPRLVSPSIVWGSESAARLPPSDEDGADAIEQ